MVERIALVEVAGALRPGPEASEALWADKPGIATRTRGSGSTALSSSTAARCLNYRRSQSLPAGTTRYPQHVLHALRTQLPMLHAQRKSIEPMVHARYHVPDEAWQFFVAEGEPAGGDYLFFGLLMASEDEADWNWVEMRLSKLIMVPGVRLDDEFTPATFPDAVPYPYAD